MRMYNKLMVLYCMVFYAYCSADIQTILSLNEVQSALESLDSNTLVVFDVDETLIVALDKIRRKNPAEIINQVKKDYYHNQVKDVAHKEYLDSIKFKMCAQKLIEPESALLIKNLQGRNIRVIALTHMRAGRFSAIESMQEWRYQELYNLGIDMSVYNPHALVLKNLPMGHVSHPVFHKGILVTSQSCSKGQTLAELLRQLEWKPSSVIFFDDLEEHINSVSEEMEKMGIACRAFHYRATEALDLTVNVELAAFQYQYLLKHGTWVSDVQAMELMNIGYVVT